MYDFFLICLPLNYKKLVKQIYISLVYLQMFLQSYEEYSLCIVVTGGMFGVGTYVSPSTCLNRADRPSFTCHDFADIITGVIMWETSHSIIAQC